MIEFNCNNCDEDGNCLCKERSGIKKQLNSEAYIPGRVIELNRILREISFGNMWPKAEFRVDEIDHYTQGCLLCLIYEEPDVNTGVPCRQVTRSWYIGKNDTESEVLRTVHKLLLGSMEHRLDEHLTYKGRRIYDPHRPVAEG